MKIAVVSDTHIQRLGEKLPKKILSDLSSADMIIHAGDLVDLSVIEDLNKLKKTIAVYGNMDPPEVRRALQEKQIIEAGKFRIGLTHGGGSPAKILDYVKNIFLQDDVDAIIFGHTHIPVNETRDGILFFNPGSLMDKIFCDFNSYGVLEIDDKITGRIIRI